MTKQDAGKDYLVCLFGDNNLDENSDLELNAIIHNDYSEGDSAFGDLLIASRDHQDIYRQSTLQDGDEPYQEVNGTVDNRGSRSRHHALRGGKSRSRRPGKL